MEIQYFNMSQIKVIMKENRLKTLKWEWTTCNVFFFIAAWLKDTVHTKSQCNGYG